MEILYNELENDINNKSVTICFVSEDEIKDLNHKYFGSNQTTDILSFSNDHIESDSIGELIINLDLIVEKCESAQKIELLTLLVHGTLHLLGYDHINTQKGNEMKIKESIIYKNILEKLDHNGK